MFAFISYKQLIEDIRILASRIKKRDFDAVCGVPRSGLMVAGVLATELHLPLYYPGTGLVGGRRALVDVKDTSPENPRILLVDDAMSSGGSMQKWVDDIKPAARATVYIAQDTPASKYDFYARLVPRPRLFDWNIMKHHEIGRTMFDMDGILCHDPVITDSEDPKAYAKWVAQAVPYRLPGRMIHTICTGRLTLYKSQTLKWLRQYGIYPGSSLGRLIMHNATDPKTRGGTEGIAKFKGQVFAKFKDTTVFVESNPRQCPTIHKLSGKPVICLPTGEIWQSNNPVCPTWDA